jgi:hypothetical protein
LAKRRYCRLKDFWYIATRCDKLGTLLSQRVPRRRLVYWM